MKQSPSREANSPLN